MTMKRIKPYALCMALLLPAFVAAQTHNLQECLQLADANSPSLKWAKADADKARVLEGTAWDLEKTSLSLSQDPTSGGSPDNALSLSQSIDFPTRYVARRRRLKAETTERRGELDAARNRLHGRVAALYYTLVYQRERLRILQRQDSILRHYEALATRRHEAGEARQLEPLNARRLLSENRLEAATAQAELAATQVELGRLLGTGAAIIPADEKLQALAHAAGGTYDDAATPEGRLAQLRLHVADAAIREEKSAFAPSLNLALRTQMVIKSWNPYHVDRGWNDGNFMGFEVGIGIPLFGGATRARVKAARKEREQAQLQAQSEAAQRQGEYAVAQGRLRAAQERLTYYEATGTAEAEEAEKISSLAYESGEIGYIEYVAAMQQSIETQLKRAAAVNDYNQATIALRTLSGAGL